ncbi:MAG: DUF4369 domain-containing protein [Flavobacteriaceae bacterium]|nr:DUF4369 domain-containing protein [Flavobacteriaceae bacterium]
MRLTFIAFILVLLCFACTKKEESNTTITGKIHGLKKGVLYLEKIEDSLMTTLDSLVMSGKEDFSFSIQLQSPEMLYLFLRKTDGVPIEDGLAFFAEPGLIDIKTSLNIFEGNAEVSGSVNHDKFEEYQKLMQRYNDKNLELFAENFQADKDDNEAKKIEINQRYESLIKSKYIATINFAMNHSEYEVAPYLALSEIYDANVKYLDTIFNKLTTKVKASMYGKELEKYIEERKALETNE